MDFEWDAAKDEANRRERGFGFSYACRIFEGRVRETPDDRRDYGETRVEALGAVGQDVLVVIYTDRADVRRIISARPANRKERAEWGSFG